MLPALIIPILLAYFLIVNMTQWHRTREAQVGTVDLAGRTVGGDMRGNATTDITRPEGAKYIAHAIVSYSTDKAALGSSCGVAVIEGTDNGADHIPLGGGGAELVNGGHAGMQSVFLPNINIPVKNNKTQTVSIQMTGEDSGDIVGVITCVYQNNISGPAKHWIGYEGQLTTIDGNLQLANLAGTTQTVPVPDSNRITDIVAAIGADLAALGSGGHAVLLLSDTGIKNGPHETVLGGYGGELATGAGDTTPPVWIPVDFEVVKSDNILAQCRMVGEDNGTMSVLVAFAFAMGS